MGFYLGAAAYLGTKVLETAAVTPSIQSSESHEVSYAYGPLSFATKPDLVDFLRQKSVTSWFPWLSELPTDITPLIACMAFGLFGGAARCLKVSLDPGESSPPSLAWPILGAATAFMLYFFAFIVPAILTIGQNPSRPETLLAISLLGGFYWQEVHKWLASLMKKLLE